MKQIYSVKNKLLWAVLLSMLWMSSGALSFAQTIAVYPASLSGTVTKCNGTLTKTFRIENSGASNLTYTNTDNYFNAANAGNISENYPNSPKTSTGIVVIGNYIYSVNYTSQTLEKYDITTQQIITSSSTIPYELYGIAYDGQYIWVGTTSGQMYNYDLSCKALGTSIPLPFNYYTALTYDGTNFIVTPALTSNSLLYKIDHSGKIIETSSLNLNNVCQLTWVPEHTSGQLYVSTNNNTINQINLTGGVANVVHTFYSQTASYAAYAIAHNGSDLIFGDWDNGLYRLNDGYQERSAISLSSYTGIINSGTTATISVTFNAESLSAGTYAGSIAINSNDPIVSNKTIDYSFTVEGKPIQKLSTTAINFGNVISGATATDTLWIKNKGCETLQILDIAGTSPVFTLDKTALNVLPGDSATVLVNFSPASIEAFNDALTITSNDAKAKVSLSGSGIAAPILSLSIDTIKATINSCGGTTTSTFAVNNTGLSNLIYSTRIDAINASYITTSPANGTISASTSSNIKVDFNASGLSAGIYNGRIIVSSNDPIKVSDTVAYILLVKGSSALSLSATAHNFGEVIIGSQLKDTLWLHNTGCDTLKVSNITGATTVFTVDKTSFDVMPNDTTLVIITFSPTAVGDSIATLTIANNATEAKISLSGKGIGAPIISASPDTIRGTITECGGSLTKSISISNTGASSLAYSLTAISENNSLSTIYAGGNSSNGNMFDVTASKDIFINSFDISNQSSPATIAVYYKPGSYVGYETTASAWTLLGTKTITGNNVALGGLKIPKGMTYGLYITTTDGAGLDYTNGANTYSDDNITITTGVGKSYPFASTFTPRTWNGSIHYSESGVKGITFSTNQGVIETGSSKSVDVTFDGTKMKAGNYNRLIFIASNDPVKAIDTVPYIVKITGSPVISVSASSLNFGEAIANTQLYDTLQVYNTGCDTLKVSNITGATSVFTLDKTTFNVLPYDTAQVIVTFAPSAVGDSVATLTILSNTTDAKINLAGKGIGAPVISLNSHSLDVISQCGVLSTKTLTISNTGVSNLTYNLGSNVNWLTLSKDNGTLAAGASTDVIVSFVADSVNAGDHYGEISISSNDPSNASDYVSCNFTVNGSPVIGLSKTTFAFPSVFVNKAGYNTLAITNTGCDTLKISDITSSINDFFIKTTSLNVLPGETENLLVIFRPSTTGALSGTITISNNDKDTTLQLTGTGILPSVESVSSITADGFYNAGKTIELAVTFNNEMNVNTDNGVPSLELNTTPVAYATYVGGLGTRDAIFQYTVGAGENSADLDYTSINALSLAGGVFTDVDGNTPSITLPAVGTFAAANSIVIDNVQPTVTITSTAADPTPQKPIAVKFNFSEIVTGLELSDIVVSNGTASNLQSTENGKVWTVGITAAADGLVTVDLASDVAQDLAGNGNVAATQFSVTYDSSLPLITLTSVNGKITNGSPFTVSITSSVPVTGLELADVVVTNGSASNLAVVTSGTNWTVNITPAAEGQVLVTIPVGAVSNASSKTNPESSSVSVIYDATAPSVIITSTSTSPTTDAKIVASIKFSERVLGFDLSDIVVGNGSASNFVSNDDSVLWTVDIAPATSGLVTLNIAAGAAKDLAGNNNSAASYSITYDNATAPLVNSLSVANVAIYSADVVVTSNKYGTAFYLVKEKANVSPSASEVVTSTSSFAGNISVTNGVAVIANISGLTANTAYSAYAVIKDALGNVSDVSSIDFATLETGVNSISGSTIRIYPNPVSSVLNIDVDKVEKGTRYSIFAINSKLLSEGSIENTNTSVTFESYASGNYILRISNNSSHTEFKVIKK